MGTKDRINGILIFGILKAEERVDINTLPFPAGILITVRNFRVV